MLSPTSPTSWRGLRFEWMLQDLEMDAANPKQIHSTYGELLPQIEAEAKRNAGGLRLNTEYKVAKEAKPYK